MNDYFQLILMIICTPFALVWICLAITKGKKYATYTKSTFAREFQMSKLFCVGFALMPILHMGTKTRRAKLKIKEIAEIKGKKYAEYYYYILQGAKITYAYTVFLVFMLLSVLAGSVEAALLGVIFSVLVVMYIDLSLQDKLTARRQEILSLEIDNGIMEADAYRNFADRCSVKEVRKFTSLILQNLQKGNEELALFLGDMSTEMWEMKKNEVKQKGEKANSRLLLPVFLIFIGILILILVPVMSGLG